MLTIFPKQTTGLTQASARRLDFEPHASANLS